MNNNYPAEPGLYFAKTGTFKWYDSIVSVQGDAPFLYIEWAVAMGSLMDRTPIYHKPIASHYQFGPKIERPVMPDAPQ